MSSKTQSVLLCIVMLISVLVAGLPVLDSSQEMISQKNEKIAEPMSDPNPLSSPGSSKTTTLQLGPDNPEHDGEAMGYIYKSSSSPYISCYSNYYAYIYQYTSSSGYSNERRGWAVFDLKDLTQWSGVNVINATLVVHHYSSYYAKVINITALKTTPYYSPITSVKQAVYTESGPLGTQIGSHTYTSKSDYTKRRMEVPLNSQAVSELNNKLSSSPTFYSFGVGMYIAESYPGTSSIYAYWYDVRLAVTFDYDSELDSTGEDGGVAFGDDLSGIAYEYNYNGRLNYYNYKYGYQRVYKYSYTSSSYSYSYDYRGYAQWDVQRIRDVLPQGNISSININKVSLRSNHYSGTASNLHIYQMEYNVTTATPKQIHTDCGDGNHYIGPISHSGYRTEYEWDLGPDAVADLKEALEDNDPSFFGLGFMASSKASYVYDFGPKLVIEWGNISQPPIADAGDNQTVDEGDSVLLDGSASNSPSGSIDKFEWDFESDGTYDYQETASGALDGIFDGRTEHIYGDNGVYVVTLKVTDDNGANDTDTSTITVNNVAPTVYLMGPSSMDEGTTISFLANATDPGSDDLTFSWNFEFGPTMDSIFYNDGMAPDPSQSPSGIYPVSILDTVNHTYGDNYNYTLVLSVTDDDGAATFYTTTINVNNLAPSLTQIVIPPNIEEGASNMYTANASDPGSDDLKFTWDWGDGSSDTVTTYYNDGIASDPIPSPWGTYPFSATDTSLHTYGDNGVYSFTLRLEDDDGGMTTYATNVTVSNVAPEIDSVERSNGDEGISLEFGASASDAGSDDLTFTWNWGDGSSDNVITKYNDGVGPDPLPSPWGTFPFLTTTKIFHTYGDNGVYAFSIKVEDDDGGFYAFSTNVIIYNVAPTLDNVTTPGGDEGTLLSYLSTASDQGSDDLTFTWKWDDGTSDSVTTYFNDGFNPDPNPSPFGTYPFSATDMVDHTYGDNGIYTIMLTVEDDDGGAVIKSANITIDNLAPTITPFGPFSFDEGTNFDLTAIATDLGSDDLTFTWELEMGPTVTSVYYNDGTGPDPLPSPWGTFPFSESDVISYMYSDDGVYSVDLTVEDDDGGISTYSTTISVGNTAPEIQRVEAYVLLDFKLRAAGEKWHNVQMFITADGEDVAFAEVVRYPGSPDDQSVTLLDVKCEVTKMIEIKVLYTPLDDPVNGQLKGATPCWVNISFEDDSFKLLKHIFNVNQPKNWEWNIGINRLLVGQKIMFEVDSNDHGSDDLKFSWDWSDGSAVTENLYCNDGLNPEPVFDPALNDVRTPWGPCPFSATDVKTHTFTKSGNYPVTLTVTDDDGGSVGVVVNVILS